MSDHIQTPVPAPEFPAPWDPFQLMDRMDEEAFRRELGGLASTDLVYVVREGGQEIVGLSKTGVDECCMALVSQGQVIREEELSCEILGEGDDREALFKVKAARFAVNPAGGEVRLDQVIGVKRQPLYFDPQVLDLDSRVPGKKFRGSTYRELLTTEDGRAYLEWMAENFQETDIREFVQRILAGEEVVAERGLRLNPHWYEAGAMKAARNARFRLIPGNLRAQVIAAARAAGKERVVTRAGNEPRTEPSTEAAPEAAAPREVVELHGVHAPTEKQTAFFRRLAASPVFTDEERTTALEWLTRKATRQSIKHQIDWLKRQVETRRGQGGSSAA